mmetsp:Transcript_43675/g.100790  ORF Transcript_43675/g.100790 Transcript_43675/m.100790 type:complete len:315 (+) Transcript_43675:99-1043(+)
MCPPSTAAADEEYESDYEDDDFISESEADEEESSSTSSAASCVEGKANDRALGIAGTVDQKFTEEALIKPKCEAAGQPPQLHGLERWQEMKASAAELTLAPSRELTARPGQDASVRLSKSRSVGGLGGSQSTRAAAEVLLQHVPSAPCLGLSPDQGASAAVLAPPKPKHAGVPPARRIQHAPKRRLPAGWPPEVPAPWAPPPGAPAGAPAPSRGSQAPQAARSRQEPREHFDCYLPNKKKRGRQSPHNEGDAAKALATPLPQLPKADGREKRLLTAYNVPGPPEAKVYKGRSAQDRLFNRILADIDVEGGHWWR